MTEALPKLSWYTRLRWWLYARCFAYCVWCMHPEADASEFSIIDDANFVAVSRAELAEIISEAPGIAWRFDGRIV